MLLQNRCLCTNTSHITIHSRGTCRYSSLNHNSLTVLKNSFWLGRDLINISTSFREIFQLHHYIAPLVTLISSLALYHQVIYYQFTFTVLYRGREKNNFLRATPFDWLIVQNMSRGRKLPNQWVLIKTHTLTERPHNLMVSLLQNLWNDLTDCTVILLRQLLWTFVAKMGPRSITNGW